MVVRVFVVVGGGVVIIKVSLSPSCRHEVCMAYSSARLRGSDAVAFWRSWVVVRGLERFWGRRGCV